MFSRSPQHDDRGDSGERNTSARQAAEALFAPKPRRVDPTVREAVPTDDAARKPRRLAVTAAVPVSQGEPDAPSPVKPVIPATHVARIRAYLKYGMTAVQVAEMYEVAVDEVERIRRPV